MEYFKICFCFSFLIWIVLHCYNTLFSSVCCPVFPCAFYSITFLSSFSISLSILVTSFLVYYFHSSLSGSCSLSISVSEIFSLFFISFGVFFSFPLLFFLPRFFFHFCLLSLRRHSPSPSPPAFSFSTLALFPLRVHLSPCRPFSFSSSYSL